MSLSQQDAKRIARRVPEEIANQRTLDLVDEVYADDAIEHGPFGMEARGRAEIKEQLREFLEAFPVVEATVDDVVAEDDRVAMRVTLRGTHERALLGIEPTGKAFEIQNSVWTRIEDGKIAERWLQPDSLGFLQQLGVVEAPLG